MTGNTARACTDILSVGNMFCNLRGIEKVASVTFLACFYLASDFGMTY
jgi:hypothetical protein